MCMPAAQIQAPAPVAAPAPLAPPPIPAAVAASTAPAAPNTSVSKVATRKNPLSIQKADSVSTGLNIPV